MSDRLGLSGCNPIISQGASVYCVAVVKTNKQKTHFNFKPGTNETRMYHALKWKGYYYVTLLNYQCNPKKDFYFFPSNSSEIEILHIQVGTLYLT